MASAPGATPASPCSFPPPRDCGGHGTLQGCTCNCNAGYANDFTNLQSIQWCVATASSPTNSTTGGRDTDLSDGIVYNSTTPGSPSGSAGASFFTSPAGVVISVVIGLLLFSLLLWCCNSKRAHNDRTDVSCCGRVSDCCCAAACWSLRACGRCFDKRRKDEDPHNEDPRQRQRTERATTAFKSAKYGYAESEYDGQTSPHRVRMGAIKGAHDLGLYQPGSPDASYGSGIPAATLISQQTAALMAMAMQNTQQMLALQQQAQAQVQQQGSHRAARSSEQHGYASGPSAPPQAPMGPSLSHSRSHGMPSRPSQHANHHARTTPPVWYQPMQRMSRSQGNMHHGHGHHARQAARLSTQQGPSRQVGSHSGVIMFSNPMFQGPGLSAIPEGEMGQEGHGRTRSPQGSY